MREGPVWAEESSEEEDGTAAFLARFDTASAAYLATR